MAAEVREEIAIRERVRPGQPAPDFSLETPDGSRLALSDLRGKYVLLDFGLRGVALAGLRSPK